MDISQRTRRGFMTRMYVYPTGTPLAMPLPPNVITWSLLISRTPEPYHMLFPFPNRFVYWGHVCEYLIFAPLPSFHSLPLPVVTQYSRYQSA